MTAHVIPGTGMFTNSHVPSWLNRGHANPVVSIEATQPTSCGFAPLDEQGTR